MPDVPCVPEWCDPETAGHDETCPNHPLEITKGAFVDACEAGARPAIETYLLMVSEGFPSEEAIQLAEAEAREGSTCFAGIGSCGRGWCKHS